MRKSAKIVLLALLCSCWNMLKAQHEYEIEVKDKNTVHVRATLKMTGNELYMPIMSTQELPDGPVELLDGIVLTEKGGGPIEIVGTKNEGNYFVWQLNKTVEELTLSYSIRMDHDKYEWPFGVEEISYRTDEGFMIIGRYLFMVPGWNDEDEYSVRFKLPDSWSVSAPWPADDPIHFKGLRGSQLRDNVLFIGSHKEEKVVVGPTELRLVLGPSLQEDKNRILTYLRPNMEAIGKLFGSAPKCSYLVVMQEGNIAGGAFNQSYSMLVEKPINEASSVHWGHGMIHETFHLWNGRGLVPNTQMEWFKEGITEYLSIQLQALTGTMERKIIEKKLESAYRRYFLSTVMGQSMSLQEAGENKNKNRMKIYGLGTFFSMVLDIEIRHANQNTKGLDEVLRLMYQELALKNKTYNLEDVVKYVNRVAGKDLGYLFEDYVTGTKPLHANEHLTKGGLQLSTMYDEVFLDANPEANAFEKSIRASVVAF